MLQVLGDHTQGTGGHIQERHLGTQHLLATGVFHTEVETVTSCEIDLSPVQTPLIMFVWEFTMFN